MLEPWETVTSNLELSTVDNLDVGLIRGIGSAGYGIMHIHPDVSLNDPNARKFGNRDVWLCDEVTENNVVAKHRHTDTKIAIPRDSVVPNLRRYAGQAKVDLTGIPEFAVTDPDFDGVEDFMNLTDEDDIPAKWPDRVSSRRGHIGLVRRVNVTAPGTHHLAYYSDESRLFNELLWVLPKATRTESKILAAWFDSTFGWLQSFFSRVETEAGWLTWYRYIVKEYRAPELQSLTQQNRNTIIEAFDEVKKAESGSLYQQLALNINPVTLAEEDKKKIEEAYDGLIDSVGDGFEAREKLDRAILKAANITDEKEQRELLNKLYRGLLLEIAALKRMMN